MAWLRILKREISHLSLQPLEQLRCSHMWTDKGHGISVIRFSIYLLLFTGNFNLLFLFLSVSFISLVSLNNLTVIEDLNLYRFIVFSVFMWRKHIPKLNITFPSEVSVLSDKRPYRNLTFHNVLARQGSSYCNRARLNFQAFALRDMELRPVKAVA